MTLTCGSTSGIATNNLVGITEQPGASETAPSIVFAYGDGSSVIISGADYRDGVVGLLTLKRRLDSFFSQVNITIN